MSYYLRWLAVRNPKYEHLRDLAELFKTCQNALQFSVTLQCLTVCHDLMSEIAKLGISSTRAHIARAHFARAHIRASMCARFRCIHPKCKFLRYGEPAEKAQNVSNRTSVLSYTAMSYCLRRLDAENRKKCAFQREYLSVGTGCVEMLGH